MSQTNWAATGDHADDSADNQQTGIVYRTVRP